MKKIFFISFLLAVLASFYYCSNLVYDFVSNIKLTKVDVLGKLQYQSPEQIYSIVSQYKGESFYSLNLDEIKYDLLRLPWIKQVYLKREWPSHLKIKLEERNPLAIYSYEGVVDVDGEIFYPNVMPTNKELPVFYCDANLLSEMMSHYDTILNFIKPINFSIKELELMPDQGWRVLVNGGINLYLGSKEIQERLKNFVVAYKVKFKDNENYENRVSYFDLRYTNGVAVKYR